MGSVIDLAAYRDSPKPLRLAVRMVVARIARGEAIRPDVAQYVGTACALTGEKGRRGDAVVEKGDHADTGGAGSGIQ